MGYLGGINDSPEDLRQKAQNAAVAGNNEEAIRLLLEAAKLEQELVAKLKPIDEGKPSSPPPCSSRANILYP